MKRKILVALSSFGEFDDTPVRLLDESGFEYVLNPYGRRLKSEEIIELGKDCEGILAGLEPYDDHVLEHLPSLRCISRCGVGIDNISLKKAQQLGIIIKNTPDAPVTAVAEMTIALILDLLRKISFHNDLMKKRVWDREIGYLLNGKKVGVLGLGRIGRRVAELLIPFEAVVYGADLFPDEAWANRHGVGILNTNELIGMCDILTIHISIIEGKEFLLDKDAILSMKRGSFLVNLSRGRIIDEDALYDALKSKHLAGAALDVFTKEPYDGPLCELENIILTPHIATFTQESRVQMEVETVRNLLDSLKS